MSSLHSIIGFRFEFGKRKQLGFSRLSQMNKWLGWIKHWKCVILRQTFIQGDWLNLEYIMVAVQYIWTFIWYHIWKFCSVCNILPALVTCMCSVSFFSLSLSCCVAKQIPLIFLMSSQWKLAFHVISHCSGHKVLSKGRKCELLCAQNN